MSDGPSDSHYDQEHGGLNIAGPLKRTALDDLLTTPEVAAILRCSPRGVSRLTRLPVNPLPVEKHTARTFRYRRADVEAFRARARKEGV